MKVAIAHEWLVTLGGSERVLLEFHELFPAAPVFTTVYEPNPSLDAFRDLDIRPSFLQSIPGATRCYRELLPLMPLAFSRFDTRPYDLVLLNSHAASKAIPKHPGQIHICYCQTPMRYAWNLTAFYLNESGLDPVRKLAARAVLTGMRHWDRNSARHIDAFIANSENVRRRIKIYYGRDAVVIPPPIDCDVFRVPASRGDYFLVVSRLVPYKRVDLAVRAFTQLGWPLHIVGDGSERKTLERQAGPSITFRGLLFGEPLAREYAGARALVFPAEEDAGIVPLEAMASGLPVLAYGAGGAAEFVLSAVTGAFFERQELPSLVAALRDFRPESFDANLIRRHAEQFDRPKFRAALSAYIDEIVRLGR